MHAVLQKASELYEAARKSTSQSDWDTYVRDLRACVIEHWEERRSIFDQAQCLRVNEKSDRHLWYFWHPTLEIFEKFVESDEIHGLFAAVLKALNERREYTPWERLRRFWGFYCEPDPLDSAYKDPSKPRLWYSGSCLEIFCMSYITLLRKTYRFYVEADNGRLELQPEPEMEASCREKLLEEYRKEMWVSVSGLYQRRLEDFSFALLKVQVDRDLEKKLEAEIRRQTTLEFSYVHWKTPYDWCAIDDMYRHLQKMLRKNRWPIMVVVPKKVLLATRRSSITNSTSKEFIKRLIDQQLDGQGGQWTAFLRKTVHGRLSIGLKLHTQKIEALSQILPNSAFWLRKEGNCVIIPPVGSVEAAVEVLKVLEQRCGHKILENPQIQIQVCCPGELSMRSASLLGVCFFLGSDTLRRYQKHDFVTSHGSQTAARFVVYGAYGYFDYSFDWWGKNEQGELVTSEIPKKISNRTDILTCRSARDIDVVNLAATLLLHSEIGGYWEDLGKQFARDIEDLLKAHDLLGLLSVPWVYKDYKLGAQYPDDKNGELFFDLFSELMEYAFAEAKRMTEASKKGDTSAAQTGILAQMQSILEKYKQEMIRLSPEGEKK